MFIVPAREIHMLRFIMEAYEGIALVTTLDSHLGLIELSVAPGCEAEVARILNSEETALQLRPVWAENVATNPDLFR
jgi:hypothetical protein